MEVSQPTKIGNSEECLVKDDILDDLFHGCAFAAYIELAFACGGVPDQEATRLLAYRYYEEALREKSASS